MRSEPPELEPVGARQRTFERAMNNINSRYIDAVSAFKGTLKSCAADPSIEQKVTYFLNAYKSVKGADFHKEQLILDFGCGSGASISNLRAKGFDAYGADILEYWGKDQASLWWTSPQLFGDTVERLRLIDSSTNQLPFPDSSIEFIFSDQTLEHVFDYKSVFAEQRRVLKDDGIAVHRFPHRFCRIEPHTRVPITPLTRFDAYLAFWAVAGLRNERQFGMSWKQAMESNRRLLATTNYVNLKQILDCARSEGLEASYSNMLSISPGRAGRFYRMATRFKLRGIARPILNLLQDNAILVLRARPRGA